ncbi:MAG: hypothetical protein NTW12_14730 [Deltaproteobacteria bacterium]|nr:hypothetical protein [Deltaproteobacteria bacterium]
MFDILILFYFIRESLRRGRPDTIFSVLPHNGAACVATIFARVIGARFIVDIHDTWPESILSVTKLNFITKVGYYVWKACADFPLRYADYVFSESVQYAERANSIRKSSEQSRAQAIYLGGDPDYYRSILPAERLPEKLQSAKFIVAYAGTLGENYDLDCLIDAFANFESECPEAGLLILGGGEREMAIRTKIADVSIKAWVSGRLPYRILLGYLKRSHIGLNCFKAGGNVAYSYKLNDYLLLGLPVINSLEGESAHLISTQDLGVNYQAGNPESLLNALRACYNRFLANGQSWTEKVVDFSSQMLDRKVNYRPLIERCLYSKSK